jgi:hypothetical protein
LFASYSWVSASISPDAGRWDFFFPLMLRHLGFHGAIAIDQPGRCWIGAKEIIRQAFL